MHIQSVKAFLRQPDLKIFTRGMRGEFLLYSGSTVMMQASKMLTILLAAKLLGPENTGWWNSLQPLLIYGGMLNFGVLNAMNRDVPYFTGRGNQEYAEYIRRVSWGITILTAVWASVFALVASYFIRDPQVVQGALRALAVLLLFQQWYTYKSMLLISAIRFKLLSVQQLAQAVLYPLFSLGMAKLWGLNGFVLGQALVNLIVCVMMTALAHYDLRPIFDWKEVRRLVGVGFPIMAGGFLYDILRTLDRWVILTFMGAVEVGYYTLAILVLQGITMLPSVVTAQFYPRMSKRFGETHSYQALKPLLTTTLKVSIALILPFGLVVLLFTAPLTRWILPDYVTGIQAAIIVAVGVMVSRPVAGTAATFLNAVGKANLYMGVQIVMIPVQVALTVAAVKMGWGLDGVAAGVAVTQVVNMLGLVGLAVILLKRVHVEQRLDEH